MHTVIICDDERIIREGLKSSIQWSDYNFNEVLLAKDGEEALELIHLNHPLLVIIDIRMPKINGIQLLENIKDISCEKIILSSYDDYEYMKAGIQHKVTDYLLKPINQQELKQILNKIYEKYDDQEEKVDIEVFKPLKEVDYDDYYVNKIIQYILKHYHDKQSVKEMLSQFDASESYLMRIFKQEVGITILDYLNRYRVFKSLHLLEHHYKHYEVADMVGFSEYKVFSYQFKKYLEVSPSDYMKK